MFDTLTAEALKLRSADLESISTRRDAYPLEENVELLPVANNKLVPSAKRGVTRFRNPFKLGERIS